MVGDFFDGAAEAPLETGCTEACPIATMREALVAPPLETA
jgi:hypothetical protein